MDDRIARIARAIVDREAERRSARGRDEGITDLIRERHRQFVEKAVAEPVRRIVEGFKKRGLEGGVTILQDRVIARVEGVSYAVHIEFQADEPRAYDSYSPEPPKALARGPLGGVTAEQLAELVSFQFLRHLEQAFVP